MTSRNSSCVSWNTKSSSPSPLSDALLPPPPPPPEGRGTRSPAMNSLLPGMHDRAAAAVAVAERRLVDIRCGNRNVFAALHVGDAALLDRFLHRLLDVRLVAAA